MSPQELYKPSAELPETPKPKREAPSSNTENQKKIVEKPETAKDRLEDFLKQEKILENIDGYNVFDINKFFSPGFIVNRLQHRHLGRIDGKKVQGSYKLMFEQLGEMPVVSQEDFEAKKEKGETIKTKPLFNIPASLGEALDINKMRQADYYLNYWDLKDSSRDKQINWQYKIKLKNGEQIGADELALFTKIFKDHQGKREQGGGLQVYDNHKQAYVKLSTDWIKANIGGLGGSPRKGNEITSGPHEFLFNQCQNLLSRGLMKFEDFKIKTSGPSGELSRKEYPLAELSDTPEFPFDGVKYYIGRKKFIYNDPFTEQKIKIPRERLKLVVLDPKTVGIVEINRTQEILRFTLDLLSEEEKEDKRREVTEKFGDLKPKEITARTFLNKKEIAPRIKPWNLSREVLKQTEENQDEYHSRTDQIDDYKFIQAVSKDFSEKAGVGIHNLSWRHQLWLCRAARELPDEFDKILNFAKNYRLEGLKTFLSCEYNLKNGNKILEISEKLDKNKTEKIINNYNGIEANARILEQTIKNSKILNGGKMSEETRQKLRKNIYEAVMSRASDILSAAYQIAKTGSAQAEFYTGEKIKVGEIDEVIEAMELYKDFLEKMKGFFTGEGKYDFDYINTVDYGEMAVSNFSVTDRESADKSFSSIAIRSQGTNKPLQNFEYDGEARINFLFSKEYISPQLQDKSRKQALTFRLDRECLIFDASGQKVIDKDNTMDQGRLSLDIGSIYEDSGEENTVLGRVISTGNFYSAREKEKKPEYYHNKESFYKDLGEADVFKTITEALKDFIKSEYIKKAGEKQLELAA